MNEIVNLSRFFILPNNIRNKMRYVLGGNLGVTLPGSSASLEFTVNGLYDVDPRVASTAIPGFTELMALYQNYRVDSCKVNVTLMNKEAFPIVASNAFTGITHYSTNGYTPAVYGNKFSRQVAAMSAIGGQDRCKQVNQVNMADLFGSTAYWGDLQSFLGTNSTNPGTRLSWNIGVAGANGESFTTKGVDFYLEFEFISEFSNLIMFSS